MDKSCGCCTKGIREYQAVCGHAESKWGNYLWEHTSFEQSMRCGRMSMAAQCCQKVDLLLWFYEIELDKESRDITTFATHEGLFRYKKTELHEEQDRNLQSDTEAGEEPRPQHQEMLIPMDKVVFMGLLESKYGIGLREERVRAVLKSSHLTTPTEVRSFLGMVGFSVCFIPNISTIVEPLPAISRKGEEPHPGTETAVSQCTCSSLFLQRCTHSSDSWCKSCGIRCGLPAEGGRESGCLLC